MTTGNYDVTLDSYNYARRTWSGVDGLRSQEHTYHCEFKKLVSVPFERWSYPYGNRKKPPVFVKSVYQTPFHGWFVTTPSFSTSQLFNTKVKLANAIRGHDWNAGVSLATLPQAVSQLKASSLAGLSLLIAIKRGDIAGAARALARIPGQSDLGLTRVAKNALRAKDIPGALLALRYGWLPTVADCFTATEAIHNGLSSAGISFKASTQDKQDLGPAGSGPSGLVDPPSTNRRVISLRAHLKSRPLFADLTGLGILDPASVAWELTPWSFVVDWFVPIGDYLRTVNTLYGYSAEVWRSTYTTRRSARTTVTTYITAYDDYRNGSVKKTHIIMDRVADSLELDLPPINWAGPLSTQRLQNAAALIYGLTGRARRA